jgi:4'-phosphopantetheinyl transferase EntD
MAADIKDVGDELFHRLAGLAASVHPGLRIGCRAIAAGDEFALTAAELAGMTKTVTSVRRARGAARMVARGLMTQLGARHGLDLPSLPSGAPRWPRGFVGSLAHDEAFAVAAVASSTDLRGIGVDIEPALPLPEDVLAIVATRQERHALNGDLLSARLLFCMKEAVYKALNPIDGVFLDYHDVDVCLASSIARTCTGYNVRIHTALKPRLIALAGLGLAAS